MRIDKVPQWSVIGLIFLCSFGLLQWNFASLGSYLTPRNFLGWAVILSISLVGFVNAAARGKMRWDKSWWVLFIPPFYILGRMFLFSTQTPSSTILSALMLLFFALFLIGLMQINFNAKHWRVILLILLLGAALAAGISFFQPAYFNIFTPTSTGLGFLPAQMQAKHAGFYQPNLMASFFATLIIWVGAMRLVDGETGGRGFSAMVHFCVVILSMALFKSGSQAGFWGLLSAAAVLLILAYRMGCPRKRVWVFLGCVLGGFFLQLFLPPVLELFFTPNGAAGISFKHHLGASFDANRDKIFQTHPVRLSIWLVCLKVIMQNPFWGVGLGAFTEVFHNAFVAANEAGTLSIVANLSHPHNEILMVIFEQGLVGLCFIFAPWLWLAWNMRRRLKGQLKGADIRRAWFVIPLLMPIGLHSLVELPLYLSGLHWLLLGLGLAWGLGGAIGAVRAMPQWRARWAGFGGLVAAYGLAIYLTAHSAYMAHVAWRHIYAVHYPDLRSFIAYSAAREELYHPFLGAWLRRQNALAIAMAALAYDENDVLAFFLPQVERQRHYFENPKAWTFLAAAYARLNEPKKLAAHLHRVKNFSRKDYERLRHLAN